MKKKPKTPGAKIRAAREYADLGQAALARAVNVSACHLWSIEHDRADPSLPLIRRIAEVLNVEPGELV